MVKAGITQEHNMMNGVYVNLPTASMSVTKYPYPDPLRLFM